MTSSNAYITEIPYISAYLEQLNVVLTDISSNYSFVVILTFSVLPKPGFCKRWFGCNDKLPEQLWTLQNVVESPPLGFLWPKSCNCSLLSISRVKARNDSHKVDVFYSVPHQRLLAKLKGYGIGGNLLNWLTHFIIRCKCFFLFIGREPTTWPARRNFSWPKVDEKSNLLS